MRREVFQTLERYGFRGNLFIYTSPYDPDYPRPLALAQSPRAHALGRGARAPRTRLAHRRPHRQPPQPVQPSRRGPRWRGAPRRAGPLQSRDRRESRLHPAGLRLHRHQLEQRSRGRGPQALSLRPPLDCGIRVRGGRQAHPLCRTGRFRTEPDEPDGGPPNSTRYITEHTDPHRLPSMELQALINDPHDFRAYLEGALEG